MKNQEENLIYSYENYFKSYKFLSAWDPLDEKKTLPPKIVVTCFIQQKNKILILQRARKDLQYKLWGIPGGKLDKKELPIQGLIREIKEEINITISSKDFLLLGTARSHTVSDGEYGLYLFYALMPENKAVKINNEEHSDFSWVTLEEFETYDLLTAQGEAYHFVENKLKKIYKSNSQKLIGVCNV